jgi:uncharacterized membrane protein (DUF106 family)
VSENVDLPLDDADADEDEEKSLKDRVERMLMIFSFVSVAFIMFNNDLRLAAGDAVGLVMNPLFRMPSHPLYTLLGAGISMIVLSTVVRHFFIDWMQMARVQEVMSEFQSELREAQKNDNHYKVNKLTDVQPEVMKLQAKMSGGQLKPMAVTMLVVIPIFAWLLQFVNGLSAPYTTIRMPWTSTWELQGRLWILPRWILIYSLFSIPFGQLTQRVLKLWEYKWSREDSATGGS